MITLDIHTKSKLEVSATTAVKEGVNEAMSTRIGDARKKSEPLDLGHLSL